MSSVFISYRRTDCPDSVGRLNALLKRRLSSWSIFYDHESLGPGDNFPSRLTQQVTAAKVVLVVIGPRWVEQLVQRSRNSRQDHVREEIRLAIEANQTIVPLLLENTAMPQSEELAEVPEVLPLLERNGFRVRPDPDFESDAERLAGTLAQHGPSGVSRCWQLLKGYGRTVMLALGMVFALAILYFGLADLGSALPGSESVRRTLDRYNLSLFRTIPGEAELCVRIGQVRTRCREILRTRQELAGWYCRGALKDKPPEYSVWTHNQAIAAELRSTEITSPLRNSLCCQLELSFSEPFWPVLDELQQPYGWRGYAGCPYTFLEPVLWYQIAAGQALTCGDLSSIARERLAHRLTLIQDVIDRYRIPTSGGWNKFPNQTNVFEHDPYCSALGLIGLLDLKAAGYGWHGDRTARDQMITATSQYLLGCYQHQGAVAGWSTTSATNHVIDGLTLMIYAVLLRAEAEAGITIPERMIESIRRHTSDFKRRTLAYPDGAGQNFREFRDHSGTLRRVQESVDFPWYPWAVEVTLRLHARLTRLNSPAEEIRDLRRTLGHLVFELSDGVLLRAEQGNTFITSEILYCFSTTP